MSDGAGLDKIVGASILGVARQLVEAGAEPTAALRLTSAALIEGSLGSKPLRDLGVPDRTLSRWRSEVRHLVSKVDVAEEIPTAMVDAMFEAMGLGQYRVVRRD